MRRRKRKSKTEKIISKYIKLNISINFALFLTLIGVMYIFTGIIVYFILDYLPVLILGIALGIFKAYKAIKELKKAAKEFEED